MVGKEKNGGDGSAESPKGNSKSTVNGRRSQQKIAEQEEKRTRREEKSRQADAPERKDSEPEWENSETEAASGESIEADPYPGNGCDPAAFPIVGVGASAGGLDALETLFSHLPEQSGIAFVVITHTHPEHVSMLPEILRRQSTVAVELLEDGKRIQPDTIYVPPSDRDPVMENGVIRLKKRETTADAHMPIDIFLRSLAGDRGELAGCIILSGTGTDGTLGIRKIKENAGVAVAQTPDSARHAGMPESAIDTGLVDFILPPAEIPGRLAEYFRNPVALGNREADTDTEEPEQLNRIIAYLAERTRHDFKLYKRSTLNRRIGRRMSVNRCRTAAEYLKFLHHQPQETQALFQDLLIGVTNFFRDPEVYVYLKEQVLRDLLARSGGRESFRAWIPGCATGEEAYSIAILIRECMAEQGIDREVQIFATDINPVAIEKARIGVYPQNIVTDVSSERLKRFFTREQDYFRAKKEIRESIVFAEQNVLRDPPFMHLDLLVCRNLLIYLEPRAQNKLIPLFHYNLKPDGILFLGTSESTGRFPELFEPVNKKFSIYKKQGVNSYLHQNLLFPGGGRPPRPSWENRQKPGQPMTVSRNISISPRPWNKPC